MTHQWRVGDLAVCVDAGPQRLSIARVDGQWYKEGGDPKTPLAMRGVYRVVAVRERHGCVGLRFREDAGRTEYWLADRFRPLVSDTDDTALIARIRACKPARQEAG